MSKTYNAKVIQLMIDYISFSGLANASLPNLDISLNHKPTIMGRIETLAMKTCFKLVMMSIVTPARALAGELLL